MIITSTATRAQRRRTAREMRNELKHARLPARYVPSLGKPNKYSPFFEAEKARVDERRAYRAAIKKAAELKMLDFKERGRFNDVAARSAA